MSTGRLHGHAALVMGGGGEIGAAIARRLASEGASAAVADLNPESAKAVAAAIREVGGDAHSMQVDVADAPSVEAAVRSSVAAFGKLTILVNVAAAITPDGTVETLTLDEWNAAIGVNLTGVFLACKYAVPEIRRAGGGSIVNIASQLGHVGMQYRAPYCSTKAALLHFTRVLAMDHAIDKIRVNSVSPGPILTERSSRRAGGKDKARVVNGPRQLLGRPGDPDEVAAGVAFLASEDAAFITATDLLIDGGYVAFKGRMGADGRISLA